MYTNNIGFRNSFLKSTRKPQFKGSAEESLTHAITMGSITEDFFHPNPNLSSSLAPHAPTSGLVFNAHPHDLALQDLASINTAISGLFGMNHLPPLPSHQIDPNLTGFALTASAINVPPSPANGYLNPFSAQAAAIDYGVNFPAVEAPTGPSAMGSTQTHTLVKGGEHIERLELIAAHLPEGSLDKMTLNRTINQLKNPEVRSGKIPGANYWIPFMEGINANKPLHEQSLYSETARYLSAKGTTSFWQDARSPSPEAVTFPLNSNPAEQTELDLINPPSPDIIFSQLNGQGEQTLVNSQSPQERESTPEAEEKLQAAYRRRQQIKNSIKGNHDKEVLETLKRERRDVSSEINRLVALKRHRQNAINKKQQPTKPKAPRPRVQKPTKVDIDPSVYSNWRTLYKAEYCRPGSNKKPAEIMTQLNDSFPTTFKLNQKQLTSLTRNFRANITRAGERYERKTSLPPTS